MTINLAVVGVGWAGSRHVEAIQEITGRTEAGQKPPLAVRTLVDTDSEHLAARARDFGVQHTVTALRGALEDPEIDAVSIATPHHLHADQAIASAEAGKHVIVEKPMAVTVEDTDRMISVALANGVRLYVAENVPYGSMTRTIRDIVRTGRYTGALSSATVLAGFRADTYGYPGRRAWLAQPEFGGSGTWLLHGVHTVAQLRAIFGEVATVYARESKTPDFSRPDLEGTMSCLLTMESGLNVLLVQSCETRFAPGQKGITLMGERGTVHATEDAAIVRSADIYPDLSDPLRVEYPAQEFTEYALEFLAFADLIEKGITGPTSAESERMSLAVVQAGYESAESGQPVNLKERFGTV
jgi:predicted dehydrogenase